MSLRTALIDLLKHIEANPGCRFDGSLYDGKTQTEYRCVAAARQALDDDEEPSSSERRVPTRPTDR